MLEYGWKRLFSGLLVLVLVIGMLPPVSVAAEETEATVQETEPVETGTVATEAVTEPVGTTETVAETEETVPETTAETTEATEETVAETTEATEPALPENVAAVQVLIDALPDVDSVTAEDYEAVQDAYDAYDALTEEEKALIQGAEVFEGLFNWFNSQTATLATTASGTCGENLTWTLDEDGTLTISGTGDMANYSSSSSQCAPWYSNRNNITAIVIEGGVTSIGNYAFYDGTKLESITIPNGVTSIGYSAFDGCSKLTSVTIPDGVTSIGSSAFDGCSKLTCVTIPDGITSINARTFFDCSSLACITIPNTVINIGDYAFYNCSKLINITIPKNVTSIGSYVFENCNNLAVFQVEEGNGNFVSVDGILYNAEKTKFIAIPRNLSGSVTIPAGITSIRDYQFYNHIELKRITLPEGVTSIGQHAFGACYNLASINIPESVTSIGDSAFRQCYCLTSIAIPRGVTNIGDFVFEQSGLAEIQLAEENTNYVSVDGILYNAKKTEIVAVPLKMTGSATIPEGVICIADWTFFGSNLTSVTIAESVTSIGEGAFKGSNLTSITIPKGVSSIGNKAFADCEALAEFRVADDNIGYVAVEGVLYNKEKTFLIQAPAAGLSGAFSIPAGVTCIGEQAFSHCDKLVSVTIPDGVTSIEKHTFYMCSKMSKIFIPESPARVDEWAFYGCESLATIHYTGTQAQWDSINLGLHNTCMTNADLHLLSNVVTTPTCVMDGYTTHTCTACGDSYVDTYVDALGHKLTFVEAVTPTYFTAGNNAYFVCSRCQKVFKDAKAIQETDIDAESLPKLPSIATGTCGDKLQWVLKEDGTLTISGSGAMDDYASGTEAPWHDHKDKITAVIVEPGVTTIGSNAFQGCPNLADVTIPESVSSIAAGAFRDCPKLTEVEVPGGLYGLDDGIFDEGVTITYTGKAGLHAVTFGSNDPTGTIQPGARVEIDGKAYTLDKNCAIWLDDANAKIAQTFVYHTGEDAYHSYPTGMYVWCLSFQEDQGTYTAQRVPELDNYFQYQGTSIRVNFRSNGIRFNTAVSGADTNALIGGSLIKTEAMAGFRLTSVGTLFKWGTLTDTDLQNNGSTASSLVYGIPGESGFRVLQKNGDQNLFTGMLTGLGTDGYILNEDLVSRPYAVLERNGETVTIYGGTIQRSIYYVAKQNEGWKVGTAYNDYIKSIIAAVEEGGTEA